MSDRFSYDRFNSSARQYDPDIAWRASESDAEEAAHLADKARRHREINGIPEPKRPVCPGCGSSTRHNPMGDMYDRCPECGYELRKPAYVFPVGYRGPCSKCGADIIAPPGTPKPPCPRCGAI